MPMLDEREYAEISALHGIGTTSVKDYRKETGAPLHTVSLAEHYAPMLARYEAMTGYFESNPNAIMHHRLSRYGPPCTHCGKPLRTPKAKLCGSCMTPRN
jgi:hypothetical protein